MFNTRLIEFVEDMDAIYDNAKQLRKGISLAIVIDRKIPSTMFKKHVSEPYSKQILARDETFLLNQDYADQVGELAKFAPAGETGQIGNIVVDLKRIWKGLSSDNKTAIWSHLQVLVTLSNKISIVKK